MEAPSRLSEEEPLAPTPRTPSAAFEQFGSVGQWHAGYCCEWLKLRLGI